MSKYPIHTATSETHEKSAQAMYASYIEFHQQKNIIWPAWSTLAPAQKSYYYFLSNAVIRSLTESEVQHDPIR